MSIAKQDLGFNPVEPEPDLEHFLDIAKGLASKLQKKNGVGFINPGSLGDWLPRQGLTRESKNNRAKGWSSNRLEGLAQEEQHPLVSNYGPPIRSEPSPRAPAAPGRPLQSEGLSRALLSTLTPRLSDQGT